MTQGLLKTSPLEAMARRKVEQKGPSSVMTFPKNLGSHGTLMRFFEYSYGGTKGSEEKRLAEIMLPLPKQIQDNFKINVGGDELGLTGTSAAQLSARPEDAQNVASQLASQLNDTGTAAYNAISGIFKGEEGAKDAIISGANTLADGVGFLTTAGLSSIVPDVSNGIGVGRGTAINPFATLVFKGVDLKVHSLEWLLSPESEEESRQLKTIIRTLQRMVLPKTTSPLGDDSNTGVEVLDRGILRYPAMCNIYLMGVDQSYYLRFKTSMISQLSVDYTPNGISIQKGGKPSAVRITMTLNEAFIHTADDNSPSDLLEEAISEKLEDFVSDKLTSDGETPEYNPDIIRTANNQPPVGNTARSSDEVTVIKTLPSGATEERVTTKQELKNQGFTDAQIAGTVPVGITGVSFQVNGA